MIAAAPQALAREELLQGLRRCRARVYRFFAGAGFGKSTIAWEIAKSAGPVTVCDMLGIRGERDAWRRLITAVAGLDPVLGERIVQESVTLDDATEGSAYLRSIAQSGNLAGTLLVENAEHLADARAVLPLRAFLHGRPGCTVVVCSRSEIDLQPARSHAAHEFVTVREDDLRFDLADFIALMKSGKAAAQRALEWSAGWPLAALRAIALLDAARPLPASANSETWLAELVRATIEGARADLREALLALAAIRNPSADEIGADPHAIAAIPFAVQRPDGTFELHALVREQVLAQYPGECAQAHAAASERAAARGDHLRFAELALQRNDVAGAADALARIDHDFYRMPPPRYVAVLEHLDREMVLQRPELWMVSEITLKSEFLELNHELEPILRARQETLSARTRMFCAALVCFRKGEYDGRWEEGLAQLDEFERVYAQGCQRPGDLVYAAMYRCGAASHAGLNFDGAAYWREYGNELARAPIFYGESLYYDSARAYFRSDRGAALAHIDRYLDHVRTSGYPAYRRASLYRALFLCWEIDAHDRYERYRRELLELLSDAGSPNDLVARLAWEMLDATRGVPPHGQGPILSTGCLASLILAAESDDFDVLDESMHRAIGMANHPALRAVNVKLAVAAFAFDPDAHGALLESAFSTFGDSAAPQLRDCVRALRAGRPAGILEPLAARFRACGERYRNRFFTDVTLARIRRGGEELHLGDRELELWMLLAGAGRPIPAIEAAELLWPQSDDASARNALKVCISRIRWRTGCKEAILATGGDVVLSSAHVQTDLDRAQRLLLLADEGSAAAGHAAREILGRPLPERMRAWRTVEPITARWRSLARSS